MKYFLVFVAAIAVVGALPAQNEGEKKPHMHHGPPKCNGIEVKFTPAQNASVKACWETYKPTMDKKEGDKKDHHPMHSCVAACKAVAFGLMDNTGKFSKDKIAPFVTATLPGAQASMTTGITTALTKCIDDNAAKVSLTMEGGKFKDCASMDALSKCTMEALKTACMPPK